MPSLDAAELVFGELSNVVRRAPGPVEVRITREGIAIRVDVIDNGNGYELQPTLPDDPYEESHRGLFIVAALAADLRVERRGARTVTSVRLSP